LVPYFILFTCWFVWFDTPLHLRIFYGCTGYALCHTFALLPYLCHSSTLVPTWLHFTLVRCIWVQTDGLLVLHSSFNVPFTPSPIYTPQPLPSLVLHTRFGSRSHLLLPAVRTVYARPRRSRLHAGPHNLFYSIPRCVVAGILVISHAAAGPRAYLLVTFIPHRTAVLRTRVPGCARTPFAFCCCYAAAAGCGLHCCALAFHCCILLLRFAVASQVHIFFFFFGLHTFFIRILHRGSVRGSCWVRVHRTYTTIFYHTIVLVLHTPTRVLRYIFVLPGPFLLCTTGCGLHAGFTGLF